MPEVAKAVKPVHGADNSPLRINLKVPFAEKDAAKALGARWDAAQKLWYVKDVADLAAFMRWIPDLEAAMEGTAAAPKAATQVSAPPKSAAAMAPSRSISDVPHCGCPVQPWEDCVHTAKPPGPDSSPV